MYTSYIQESKQIDKVLIMVLREKTYKIIKERIVSGQYRPGQPLNEKEIIEELNISRTPFREAVHALNEENLVQIFPNRGIFVRELTFSDITNGFNIRYLLEPYVVELASVRMPKRVMEELIKRIEEVDRSDYSALLSEDDHFHTALLQYVDNNQLSRIMMNLYEYNHFQVVLIDDTATDYIRNIRTSSVYQSLDEHKAILNHMLCGDTPGAVKAMQEHIINAKKRLLQ
jgi:DNA-binding GntR family transcriptional regulator